MESLDRPAYLYRLAAACAYLFALGWGIGGALLFGSNIIIYEDIQYLERGLAPVSGGNDMHLAGAWWMMWGGYFIFIFSDFGLILLIAIFTYLFAPRDPRMWLIALSVAVWMTVALVVDCGLAGASWIVGIKSAAGTEPALIKETFANYDHHVLNLIRWPVRGMYLFVGIAMACFAWIARGNGWPKGLVFAAWLLAACMGIEVLTFAITVLFGSSPIHLPAYCLMFFVGAPFFGLRIANAFRLGADRPA